MALSWWFQKGTTLIFKSKGNGDKSLNPIYGCEGKITPDVNPKWKVLSQGFQKCISCWYWTCKGCFIDDWKLVVVGGLFDYRVRSLLRLRPWQLVESVETENCGEGI